MFGRDALVPRRTTVQQQQKLVFGTIANKKSEREKDNLTCGDVVSAHDSHGFPPLIVITSLLLPFEEGGTLFPFITLLPDGRTFPPPVALAIPLTAFGLA